MINYTEVFSARHQHGRLFKNTINKQSAIDFRNFLKTSPDSVEVRINNSKLTTVATILEKEKETQAKRYFLCDKSDKIKVGDFLYWEDSIWLLFLKTRDTISVYDKFEALECKHFISWIDNFGIVQKEPCYLLAQTDKAIKSNFRTWNNMITPQPNKHMEIVTSRKQINLGQKFLIDDTAWYVVETDYISVKDIIYLSLTEDKIDIYNDNIEQQLANFNQFNKYKIVLEKEKINLGINEEYKINGKIYLNGNFYSDNIDIEIVEGAQNITLVEKTIMGKRSGISKVKVSMTEDQDVFSILTININNNIEPDENFLIIGDSNIKWGRTKTYQVVKTKNGQVQPINAVIAVKDLNNLCNYEIVNNTILITANQSNKVGSITITAEYNGQKINKEVNIISLWM